MPTHDLSWRDQCCPLDDDFDGNCRIHSSPGVLREVYSPREATYNAKNCPPSVGPQCKYIHADGVTQCDFKVPDGRGPYCLFHRAAVRLEVFEAKAKAWDCLMDECANPWGRVDYIPERFMKLELRNKE